MNYPPNPYYMPTLAMASLLNMSNFNASIQQQSAMIDCSIAHMKELQDLEYNAATYACYADMMNISKASISECCTDRSASIPTKTNCCNCGAPLKKQTCEYCGTINR